ncbi:pectin acetylesterase 2-like [Miscanthus floridulus]|uniref:pectin acetylesterase 2-like n=1 Tax=Miscanthus floridulus TaxID=154761 RepID=UPI003458BB23
MAKGMDTAKQVLLAGCSAGGLTALLNCDNFRARFPPEVPVKCLSDAGFFLDVKDSSGERFMRSIFSGVVHLQNVRKALPKDCLAKKEPTEVGNVVAPGGSDPGQSWASCKADIRNCTSTQIEALNGFREKIVEDLKVAQHKRGWGLFTDSCFNHCQTPFRIT